MLALTFGLTLLLNLLAQLRSRSMTTLYCLKSHCCL